MLKYWFLSLFLFAIAGASQSAPEHKQSINGKIDNIINFSHTQYKELPQTKEQQQNELYLYELEIQFTVIYNSILKTYNLPFIISQNSSQKIDFIGIANNGESWMIKQDLLNHGISEKELNQYVKEHLSVFLPKNL